MALPSIEGLSSKLGGFAVSNQGVRRDPCKVLVFSEVQVLTRQLGRSSR